MQAMALWFWFEDPSDEGGGDDGEEQLHGKLSGSMHVRDVIGIVPDTMSTRMVERCCHRPAVVVILFTRDRLGLNKTGDGSNG